MSEVSKFYSGKTILLTGGTGFLGKVLIEKMLYSCSDINRIYVLVRDKKGKSALERINQLFNMPAFERLKRRPNCLSKIVVLPGSVTKPNLGVTDDQVKCLINEVSIVFHLAATVNFNETLQDALDVNVIGTMEVIKLCRQMKYLEAFIHVSTAFSNAERKVIDEVVYPPPHDLLYSQLFAKVYSDNHLAIKRFLGGKPNTYTYSKALAEGVILKSCVGIPTAIIRPSIVMASLKEPCPGWVNNWAGATGICVGVSTGMMKTAFGRGNYVTDLIPVDIVTNLCIVAASRCQSSKELKVYNCCSGTSNPVTFDQCLEIVSKTSKNYSLCSYSSKPYLTSCTMVYYLLYFILQLLPAMLLDLWSYGKFSKIKFMKMQLKLNKMVQAVKFFVLHEWHFIDDNVRHLWQSISEEDKGMFNFDIKSIDWKHCIENFVLGTNEFLLGTEKVS